MQRDKVCQDNPSPRHGPASAGLFLWKASHDRRRALASRAAGREQDGRGQLRPLMTFTVTLVNQHGIWQSSDLRITDPKTGQLVDDFSIKQLSFRCPDGAALLTYSGAGSVGGVQVSDWIRQFLRGETRTVDQTLIQIREHATRDLGPLLLKLKIKHMFNVGAFLGGVPWIVQIRNFQVSRAGEGPVEREFQTSARKVTDGAGFVVPWPCILSMADLAKLVKISDKRPRKPSEFSDLLGEVNLRTARSYRQLVSERCVTTYQPPSGDGLQTYVHNAPKRANPIVPGDLLFGIDVTEIARALAARPHGVPIPEQTFQETVLPKNSLRRK